MARLKLLSTQADAGFMRHVLDNPASNAQRDKATEFLAVAGQEIKALEAQVGDPDAIPDKHGDLPAARRGYNLDSHMRLFRHETLRTWSKGQRPRFRQLLAMPVPQPADMCAECQAPADWHTYGVSLRLFQPKPEPGSQAETIARLMPGWWERCPASTSIQIRLQWGQGLPDFDGAQWQAMLTPLLRAIFAPDLPRHREKPDRRAALERRLRSAEAEASRIRREIAELGLGTGEGRHQ
jgi:nitroreductase